MMMKLRQFLNLLNIFKRRKSLSHHFAPEENIARTIFTPIHVKNHKIKTNAFRPQAEEEGISVNRLTYTTPDFVKKLGKEMENPESKKEYFGLGVLKHNEIIECEAAVEYTPQENNIYHSDIKIGYIPQRGDPLPAEYQRKVRKLAEKAKLYEDPDPSSTKWEGETIN